MENRSILSDALDKYINFFSDIGIDAAVKYQCKNENEEVCDETCAAFYSACVTLRDGDKLLLEKEYLLPIEAKEIESEDLHELSELLTVAEGKEDAKCAIIAHLEMADQDAKQRVGELEDEFDKKAKMLITICAAILGVTALAAIVLSFVL